MLNLKGRSVAANVLIYDIKLGVFSTSSQIYNLVLQLPCRNRWCHNSSLIFISWMLLIQVCEFESFYLQAVLTFAKYCITFLREICDLIISSLIGCYA